MQHHRTYPKLNGRKLKVAVIVARYEESITSRLLGGCLHALRDAGVLKKNITVQQVPGSFELPFAAARFVKSKSVHAVICLGCILKGETNHDEVIAHSVAHALQRLNIQRKVPVLFGVLTPRTRAQALARSRPDSTNKGYETAMAAVEIAMIP